MSETTNHQSSPEDHPPLSEDLPLIDLEAMSTRRPSWRKRAVQLALLALVTGVALAAVWRVLLPPPPAPPTVSALLTSNVNYGSVTVNGVPVAGAPPLFITLYQNAPNTITLVTPPFRPLTCHFSLTRQPHGQFSQPDDLTHCEVDKTPSEASITINGVVYRLTVLVRLTLMFTDLPADQGSQVASLITRRVARPLHTIVPRGEYIVTGNPSSSTILTSQRTTEPLTATASLVPYLTGIFCSPNDCRRGFDPSFAPSPPAGHIWSIFFPFGVGWRFTDASGAAVSDVMFPEDPNDPDVFFLSYNGKQGWHIVEGVPDSQDYQLQDLLCGVGIERLRHLLGMGASIHADHDRGVEGCALYLLDADGSKTYFIWRFGVLLAVDGAAQARVPLLPLAPPGEVAAVGE